MKLASAFLVLLAVVYSAGWRFGWEVAWAGLSIASLLMLIVGNAHALERLRRDDDLGAEISADAWRLRKVGWVLSIVASVSVAMGVQTRMSAIQTGVQLVLVFCILALLFRVYPALGESVRSLRRKARQEEDNRAWKPPMGP